MHSKSKRAALLGATAALAIAVGTAQAQTTGGEGFGDFVWDDLNQNGVQEAGEPGIAGVTVNLYRSDDAFTSVFATDITDAGGLYFLDIGSGAISHDWVVEFVRPAGFLFSPADQGANDALDSDVIDALTGRTAVIPGFAFPFPEGPILTVDAGMFRRAAVPEPGVLSLIAAAFVALAGCASIRRRFSRAKW